MAKNSKKNKNRRPAPAAASSAPDREAKAAAKELRRAEAATAAAARQAEQRKSQRRANLSARRQWIALGVIVVGLFGFAFYRSLPESGETSADAWDLPVVANDPDGDGRLTLAEFGGKPTVVNFYASWCEACDAELPAFASVSTDLRDQVHFVGINTQDDQNARAMPERHGVGWWPLGNDINGLLNNGSGLYDSVTGFAGAPNGMPVTAFYDDQGNRVRTTSILNEASLRANIAELYGIS